MQSPFDDKVAKDSLFSLQKWCEKHNVQHIRSVVTELNKGSATMKNGDTVDFDVCVVAVGASMKASFLGRRIHEETADKTKRLAFLKSQGEKMVNAESVLIVGGGLVGTELAGDLAEFAKKKGKKLEVTLVHSGASLCPELNEAAARRVEALLKKLGVKVILNDKVIEKTGDMVLESSGEKLEGKEVVWTTGVFPVAKSFMKNSTEFADAFNDSGWLETDEYMRVKGTGGKIFAFGDCSALLPKTAHQLFAKAPIIGHNLKVTLDHQMNDEATTGKFLKKAVPGPGVVVVTTGPSSGVAYIKGMFHTTWLLPALKNKTMFFFNAKSELQF
jgi:apoptosis-inducing factor 2